jgi:hypothetical protein
MNGHPETAPTRAVATTVKVAAITTKVVAIYIITLTFGIEINKDIVRRIFAKHYKPGLVYYLFNLHRHSLCRRYFKLFRIRSFTTWDTITAP